MLRLDAFAYSGPRRTVWFHRASGVSVKARVSDICNGASHSTVAVVAQVEWCGEWCEWCGSSCVAGVMVPFACVH